MKIPKGGFFSERADFQLSWEFLHVENFDSCMDSSFEIPQTCSPNDHKCSHTINWNQMQLLEPTNISV